MKLNPQLIVKYLPHKGFWVVSPEPFLLVPGDVVRLKSTVTLSTLFVKTHKEEKERIDFGLELALGIWLEGRVRVRI